MVQIRTRHVMGIATSLVIHIWLAGQAMADDCSRFEQHRDGYLYSTSTGMTQALEGMARQRGVPVEVAAFYWGGTLMQNSDPASLRSLAQLTLATYNWPGNEQRAETAMARIFDERNGRFAGLLVGLMLSDRRGSADSYRARAYLADASRRGSADAAAFLRMHDACYGRAMALN
jgi:hypothetical protein